MVVALVAMGTLLGVYGIGRAVHDPAPAPERAGTELAADAVVDPQAQAVADAVSGHDHESGAEAVDDRGFSALENGEQHGHEFTQPVSPEDRTELARQLTLAREVAMRYPTVADAEAAGMRRAGPFSPGLGAHYLAPGAGAGLNVDGVMSDDDIANPIAFIYDGVDPDSRITGLFYMSMRSEYPEGFAGPNDTWHKHSNICIVARPGGGVDTPLGADREIPKDQCDAVGGQLLGQTSWLVHVWPVPGYESPEGVFSHLSSAVTCPDGTYHTIELSDIGDRDTVCRGAA